MNTIETRYQAWLAQPGLPEDLAAELRGIAGQSAGERAVRACSRCVHGRDGGV